jgi:hypothetical protein
MELNKREGHYIRTLDCVNKRYSWYEHIKNLIKNEREANREKDKERHKQYRENNKEKIKEQERS